MANNIIPIVEIAGSPYKRGQQYGEAVRDMILENIELYLKLFHHYNGISKDLAIKYVEKYKKPILDFDPDLLSEIQGIADACNVSVNQIMMLNARTELLSKNLLECTSFAVLPAASLQSIMWLGQNWDWLHVVQGKTVLLKVKQNGKPNIMMLVEAGQIGKMGFNDCGIGLCHNSLDTDQQSIGVPFIVLCRIILNHYHLNKALHAIQILKRSSPANYLIAHRDGIAIDLETIPDKIEYIEPRNNFIVHTNHFVSRELKKHDRAIAQDGWDSVIRKQRAEYLLNLHCGFINLELLIDLQRDSACGLSSICVQPNITDSIFEQWSTLAGVILNLTEMAMYISAGNPIMSDYQKFNL